MISRGTRSFVYISIGQVVSALGSGLSDFGFGVWVLKRTESITEFSVMIFMIALPRLALAPLVGVIVDRYSRRRIMILSDVASAVLSLILAALALAERLPLWAIIGLLTLNACASTVHGLAYVASVSLLVKKEHLTRASGVAQTGLSAATIVAPFLGGLLIQRIDLVGVLAVDGASFVIAGVLTSLAVIPQVTREGSGPRRSFLQDTVAGFSYMRGLGGLLALNGFLGAVNLVLAMGAVLKPPLLLSFSAPETVGAMFSVESVGFLLGGLAVSTWGGPKRLLLGVLVGALGQFLALILVGLRPSALLAGAGLFLAAVTLPLMRTSSRVIMQRKVPSDQQGRVFGAAQLVSQSAMPLAALSAGPLADTVFKPLLVSGGALAPLLGAWFGIGPVRGVGLLLAVIGSLGALVVLWAAGSRALRSLEASQPDADLPPSVVPRGPRSGAMGEA
jgi:MFS transporter, DHA3 family, macrolide efflux protein